MRFKQGRVPTFKEYFFGGRGKIEVGGTPRPYAWFFFDVDIPVGAGIALVGKGSLRDISAVAVVDQGDYIEVRLLNAVYGPANDGYTDYEHHELVDVKLPVSIRKRTWRETAVDAVELAWDARDDAEETVRFKDANLADSQKKADFLKALVLEKD